MRYFTKMRAISDVSPSRAIYANYPAPDRDLNDVIRCLIAREGLGN
jgi:hypothetical protein